MPGRTVEKERVEHARSVLQRCRLCHRRCGVDRTVGQRGFCGAGESARVYRHRGECGAEVALRPSHLFYLSGCNSRCGFCIGEHDAFDPLRGQPLNGRFLADALAVGRQQGAVNLQWVGGEPTIHLPAILDAMAGCETLPPVVWKSNFFSTMECNALLDGIVDYFVADLKFGNDACARRIAGVEGYMDIVHQNLLWAREKACLIVRHLVLPGHEACCLRPTLDWLQRNLPTVPLRLMTGYLPRWQAARYPELSKPLDRQEAARAFAFAKDSGLHIIS